MKCMNPVCTNDVDALHMSDDGYCNDCHNKMLDDLLIEESEETRYLSDMSLAMICNREARYVGHRSSRRKLGLWL